MKNLEFNNHELYDFLIIHFSCDFITIFIFIFWTFLFYFLLLFIFIFCWSWGLLLVSLQSLHLTSFSENDISLFVIFFFLIIRNKKMY